MAEQVFPTKGNLMKAKKTLSLCKLGYELMDRKRNILIREMMTLIEKGKALRDSIAAAAKLLAPLCLCLIFCDILLRRNHGVSGGYVHDPGGDDFLSVEAAALLLQGEKIQKHLKAHAVPHIGKGELFLAGFIVHHAKIELVLMDPPVHAVHLTVDTGGHSAVERNGLSEVILLRHGAERTLKTLLQHHNSKASISSSVQFSSLQSLSRVRLFATP